MLFADTNQNNFEVKFTGLSKIDPFPKRFEPSSQIPTVSNGQSTALINHLITLIVRGKIRVRLNFKYLTRLTKPNRGYQTDYEGC